LVDQKVINMNFFLDISLIMYFLMILAKRFETFDFTYIECCVRIDNEGTKDSIKKKKVRKDVNDDELVRRSSSMVLEVNKRWYF
jgi:hypothetical protein